MKRSNIWFVLILILSASLLSGAKNANANPTPSGTIKPNESRDLVQQPAQNYPSPVTVTNAPKTPEQTPTPRDDGGSGQSNSGVMIFLTGVMAVATFGIMIFNGQLVSVTNKMKEATETALHLNRPFLFVTGVRCPHGFKLLKWDSTGDVFYTYEFEIDLTNFGLGPADIFDYSAGAAPLERDIRQQPLVEPQIVYAEIAGNRLSDPLIGPKKTVEGRIRATATLTVEQNDAVRRDEKAIAIDGIIRYRGAAAKPYWTKFFWWCFLDAYNVPCNIQRALRPDLNDHI